jgi:hypothetical protein
MDNVECTREEYHSEEVKILIEEFKYIQMLMIIINPTEISKENTDSSYR